MDKVTQINVAGQVYELVAGNAVEGSCGSAADAFVKLTVLSSNAPFVDGMMMAVTFEYGNTAGLKNPITVYSSDGVTFYYDQAMTDAVTLPPVECYTVELVSGNQYKFQSFPALSVNGVLKPVCDSRGYPSGGNMWKDGDTVTFVYVGNKVINVSMGGSGSGITVYPTQQALEEDLPNLSDDDLVATYGEGDGLNDAPLGTVAEYLGNTDPADGKWLICDGRDTTGTAIELRTHYPSLYMFLGATNVLPDYTARGSTYIIKATTTADVSPLPSESIAEIESFATSLIASKLGNLLQVDVIYNTVITTTGATSSLITGYKFSDYDFIITVVSFYDNSQNNFMLIPKANVLDGINNHSTNSEWFLQGASTGGTDRRVGFTLTADTTFKVTMINGTSGHMPRFQGIYGVKFNVS